MSWNIRIFGTTKLQNTRVVSFITTIIDLSRAGIVGIMEIRGQDGPQILNTLIAGLNARRGANHWEGVISEPLFDINDEQYIFLWDTNQQVQPDLFEFITPGILSENAFEFLNWSQRQLTEVLSLLEQHNFLFVNYFLNIDMTNQLEQGIDPLRIIAHNCSYAIDDEELLMMREVLLNHRNLGLNEANSRPPFQALFKIGPNRLRLPVVMLHAPNPTDIFKVQAINVLSNVAMLLNYSDGLVMGDFNIPRYQNILDQVYLVNGHNMIHNGQVVMQGAFQGLMDFGYEEVLNRPSSLKTYFDKSATGPARYMANHYDRFFLRVEHDSSFTLEDDINVEVHDVIRLIYQSANGLVNPQYANEARQVLFLNQFHPISYSVAHEAYLEVSDHMPIIITLDY